MRQSLKGTILQPATRRHVNTLLYLHFVITVADISFTVLGTLLDYHVGNSCYVRNHVHTAIVVVIVGNYFIIACNFLGVALIFSVFCAPSVRREMEQNVFRFLGVVCVCQEAVNASETIKGPFHKLQLASVRCFRGLILCQVILRAGLALLALQHRGVLEGKPLGWNVLEGE